MNDSQKIVYIIGNSHAINPMHALSADSLDFNHYNWNDPARESVFRTMRCKEDLGIFAEVRYFLILPKDNLNASYSRDKEGKRSIVSTPSFLEFAQKIENHPRLVVFSFINGNEHSSLSMIEHEVAYDFMRPGDSIPQKNPLKPIIPLSIIRNQIYQESQFTYAPLEVLRMILPQAQIYHFAPPPPIALEQQIRANPEVFGDALQTYKITEPRIRLKYYQEYIDGLKEALKSFNIALVPPPANTCTQEGFLAEPYWYAATHANIKYAELVAQQMKEILQ